MILGFLSWGGLIQIHEDSSSSRFTIPSHEAKANLNQNHTSEVRTEEKENLEEPFHDALNNQFSGEGVQHLVIENAAGKVKVLGVEGQTISIEAHPIAGDENHCEMNVEKIHDTATVRLREKKRRFRLFNRECVADLVIQTPRSMDLDLRIGSGDAKIYKVHGSLSVRTGSGDIEAEGLFKDVNLIGGSGDVFVSGLAGSCSATMGSGNSRLIYSTLPEQGHIKLRVGSGDTTVIVPPKSKIATKVQMSSGAIKSELDNKQPGLFVIEGTVGSGNLYLRNP